MSFFELLLLPFPPSVGDDVGAVVGDGDGTDGGIDDVLDGIADGASVTSKTTLNRWEKKSLPLYLKSGSISSLP